MRARADGVRAARAPARSAQADRPGRGDRHGDRHPAGGRLADGLPESRPRGERDRDDEHPRRVRRARLAGAEGRLQVVRPLLRLRAGRPGVLHRGDAAAASAAHAPGVRHRRGREGGRGLRAAQPRRHRHRAAVLQRARARPAHLPHEAVRPAGRAVHPRLRPALPVHPRGGPRRRAAVRRRARPARHLQRGRRRRARAVGGRVAARQAARADPAAVGQLADRRRAAAARRQGSRRGPPPAPLRPRARQSQAEGDWIHLRLHEPRDRAQVRGGDAHPPAAPRRGRALPLRARGRGLPSLEPERAPQGHGSNRQTGCKISHHPPGWLPFSGLYAAPPDRCHRAHRHRAPGRGREPVRLRPPGHQEDRRRRDRQRGRRQRPHAGAGAVQARGVAAGAADPAGERPLQGPALHAHAREGARGGRHRRLGRPRDGGVDGRQPLHAHVARGTAAASSTPA